MQNKCHGACKRSDGTSRAKFPEVMQDRNSRLTIQSLELPDDVIYL
jgi:hypothetical protein